MLNGQVFRTVHLLNEGRQMRKQAGFASILFILLIGLALTVLIVGMVSSVRGLQDSSLISHAQTQAQIKSTIGYQALSGLLENLSATEIDQINNGEIKKNGSTLTATYKRTFDCPSDVGGTKYFCFDVKAISGGASSIVRAIYASKTTGGGTFDGSIFAGGLQVGQERNLKGNQTIQVGDAGKGNGIVSGNGSNYYTVEDFLNGTGFTVQPYQPTTFITAAELRPFSNYIFYANGTCAKNNIYGLNIYNVETTVTCDSISGISTSGSGTNRKWTIDASSSTIPVGVLWFEGQVDINLKSSRDLVNTIIATGEMQVITTNQGGAGKAYAPYPYYLESNVNLATKKARVCSSSSSGIPTQYCDTTGNLKEINTEKANISNILFFSNKNITFDVKKNSPMSLYGNIMGSGGAGGTGAASGKFNGTGKIDIKGNVAFTGKGVTTTNGNVNVTINSGNTSGSITPSKAVITLSSLRYM